MWLLILSSCVLLESSEITIPSSESFAATTDILCSEDPFCLDSDGDGSPEAEDCNDLDASLLGIAEDLDCDGLVNEGDPCPEDPFDDVDDDGICGDQDSECNRDFAIDTDYLDRTVAEMNSCLSIEGDIYIYDTELEVIPVFAGTEVIKGSIFIGNNSNLMSIDSFSSLVTMTGSLRVQENPVLSSISGFDSLAHIERIELIGNQNLCVSTVIQFLEDLEYPDSEQFGNDSDC